MTFVDQILAAPVGVALLGRLEARHLPDAWRHEVPDTTSPKSVAAAAAEVAAMPIGELLSVAVEAGYRSAGPWSGSANVELQRAYRDATDRVSIAEVVARRFDEVPRVGEQEWWHTNHRAEGWFARPHFVDLDESIYENGEFTFAGVWTTTSPPTDAHQWLASAWELDEHPISRWRLPVKTDARIAEINGPDDWLDLMTNYGRVPERRNYAWEMPGANDHNRDPLLAPASGGRAARNEMHHLVVPTWTRIAHDYDGVRLTWRGWLTTEGFISDTADGGLTWMRYWFSERTLWLNDVFGEPEPLTGPTLDDDIEDGSIDVITDLARREQDRDVLRAMLGR